jgi:ribosomal-protein-alanine N-acetyltransferase
VPADALAYFDVGREPEVARYTSWAPHASPEESRAVVGRWVEGFHQGRVTPWAVVHTGEARLIGTCGFLTWVPQQGRAEIAYALHRGYWNRGYATEAVRAVLAFGFATMDLVRIQATCKVANPASARVMEKAGMVYEGTLRACLFNKGEYHDLQMWAVLRQDWPFNAR